MLASESLFTLESLVNSARQISQKFMGEHGKSMPGFNGEVLLNLHQKLGISAVKILKHDWDTIEHGWKSKVRILMLTFYMLNFI